MAASQVQAASTSSAPLMVVKNTFLEFKDEFECPSPVMRRRRLKTWGCASKLQVVDNLQASDASDDFADYASTISEMDTMSATSSCSQPAPSLAGRVWSLSQDALGCREVQDVLGDDSLPLGQREALARELRGRILSAAVCPYANFVLQKCVVMLRPEAVQFIMEEILADSACSVSSVAQNKFGCRVLQRLLERCHSPQVSALVEAVLADFVNIAQSPYGNYVVQKILECAGADSEQQRLRIARLVEGAVGDLGAHPCGCIVITNIFCRCSIESGRAIARAMLEDSNLLKSMACTRHGHRTILASVDFLESGDFAVARGILERDASLAANKFGRAVLAHIRQV